MTDPVLPRTYWSPVEALSFALQYSREASMYLYCSNEDDYLACCRSLIDEREINREPSAQHLVSTRVRSVQRVTGKECIFTISYYHTGDTPTAVLNDEDSKKFQSELKAYLDHPCNGATDGY